MDGLVRPQPTNRATEFVDKLNRGFNLDLRVPDLTWSPKKRRAAQTTAEDALAEHIHSLIRQLALPRPGDLLEIERRFEQEARAICSNWVSKPRAVPDLLPVTPALPKASNVVERAQLRDCLLEIILPFHRDHQNRQQAERSRNRKRLSDEILRESDGGPATPRRSPSKRARSALDQVPVRATSPPLNGPTERSVIPANRSFGPRSNPAANHPPPYHSFSGPPPAAPQPFGPHQLANPPSSSVVGESATDRGIINQESANTSITTHHDPIFSFPAPYDSDSSQATVPNDDREEYKDAALAVDVAFYRPETRTRPTRVESAAARNNGDALGSSSPPFTSSEEVGLMALDATTPDGCGAEVAGAPGTWSEAFEDLDLPDVPPVGLDQNAMAGAGAKFAIRQRDPISSAASVPATDYTDWSADVDHQLPVYGGLPVSDEPHVRLQPLPLENHRQPLSLEGRHQPPSLEDRLRNSWRE